MKFTTYTTLSFWNVLVAIAVGLTSGMPASAWAVDATIEREYRGQAHRNAFEEPSGERAGGYSVVSLPNVTIDISDLRRNDDTGSGLRIKAPSQATIDLTNKQNEKKATIKLTVIGIKAQVKIDPPNRSNPLETVILRTLSNVEGCKTVSDGNADNILNWQFKSGSYCVLSLSNQVLVDPVSAQLTDIKLAYDIDWGELNKLSNGVYEGTWHLEIGNENGLGLGNSARTSDASLPVTIRLTMAHDIQVLADEYALTLKPIGGSWESERENINGMEASTMLTISAGPEFTVHVACNDQVDDQCALRHAEESAYAVPVYVKLDLPDVKMTSAGRLPVAQPGSPRGTGARLKALQALNNVRGKIIFSVDESNTKRMLQRPGIYRGQLSVVFDAMLSD